MSHLYIIIYFHKIGTDKAQTGKHTLKLLMVWNLTVIAFKQTRKADSAHYKQCSCYC